MLNCLVKGFVQFGFSHVLNTVVQTIFRQRGLCSCCNYCMYAWALAERIANTSVGSSRIPKLIVLQALLLSPWLGHVNHCLEVTYISLFHVPCLKKKKRYQNKKRHADTHPEWCLLGAVLLSISPEWLSLQNGFLYQGTRLSLRQGCLDSRMCYVPLAEQLWVTQQTFPACPDFKQLSWPRHWHLKEQGITSLPSPNFEMLLLDSDAGTCAGAGEPTSCLRMFANPKFQRFPGLARTSKPGGTSQHRWGNYSGALHGR